MSKCKSQGECSPVVYSLLFILIRSFLLVRFIVERTLIVSSMRALHRATTDGAVALVYRTCLDTVRCDCPSKFKVGCVLYRDWLVDVVDVGSLSMMLETAPSSLAEVDLPASIGYCSSVA